VSGAGKSLTEASSFCQAAEGISAYAPVGHPHQSEIERELARISPRPVSVTFTPHLAPFVRGLLVTAYARLDDPLDQQALDGLYAGEYAGERFVKLVGQPRTQTVRGANLCHIGAWADPARSTVVACAALDNLVKGAAGQAIQNANLMVGLAEHEGLPEAEAAL